MGCQDRPCHDVLGTSSLSILYREDNAGASKLGKGAKLMQGALGQQIFLLKMTDTRALSLLTEA